MFKSSFIVMNQLGVSAHICSSSHHLLVCCFDSVTRGS